MEKSAIMKFKKNPLFSSVVRKAIIYDNKGQYNTTINITGKHDIFHYKNRSYNILLNGSCFKYKTLFKTKEYYFYTIDNPNPLLFDNKSEPVVNSEIYNVHLTTKVARDLNNTGKPKLSDLFTPRNMIIGIVVIIVIYYLISGNLIPRG